MHSLELLGLWLMPLGVIVWSVGGLISLATRPDVHNRLLMTLFDPMKTTPLQPVSGRELRDAFFTNPKSRWWCLIGLGICVAGMALTFISDYLH